MNPRWLSLDDIADARAYEREREEFRSRVIELKKKRRVSVGPVVTLVFENRDTIRFQVQEMARAERLLSDEAIEVELDTYNPLIPGPGELSASLYIELTSRQEMEKWLPGLVGIERCVTLEVGPPGAVEVVRCQVDEQHASHLTREEVTAAVHFVRFALTEDQVDRFRAGPVWLALDHPNYTERTELGNQTRSTLVDDLSG